MGAWIMLNTYYKVSNLFLCLFSVIEYVSQVILFQYFFFCCIFLIIILRLHSPWIQYYSIQSVAVFMLFSLFSLFSHCRSHLHCNLNLIEFCISYFLYFLFPFYAVLSCWTWRFPTHCRLCKYIFRIGFKIQKNKHNLICIYYISDCWSSKRIQCCCLKICQQCRSSYKIDCCSSCC